MPTTTNPSAPLHGDYRDFSKGGRYGPTGENAPVQTGVENGRNQFDYWETDPTKVNAYLAANSDDPKIIQAAARGDAALDHELHSRGIRVPEHYKAAMGRDGKVIVKEMSWWDKHKNWALPAIMMGGAIAAGPAIGALSGGGSGGAGAAAAGAGGLGETGAVTGLAGSGFGTGSGLGITGVASGFGGAASSTLPAAAGGQAMSTLPAGGSSVLGGGGGGGSLTSQLLQRAGGRDNISTGIGALTRTQANNRGVALDANLEADKIRTQRQAEDRNERESAWKGLHHSDYTMNSQGYTNPQGLPSFGIARTGGPSAAVRAGSQGLQAEVLKRLQGGSQLPPVTDANKMSRPGKVETALNWAGPIASMFGY